MIFSLDAILSLIAGITLISASFFYLSQIHVIQWSEPSHFLTAIDTLNVLRIDGTFGNAIATDNGARIKEFFDVMYPENICGALFIYQENATQPFINETKTGCSTYDQVYVFRSTIYTRTKLYYILLRIWYV